MVDIKIDVDESPEIKFWRETLQSDKTHTLKFQAQMAGGGFGSGNASMWRNMPGYGGSSPASSNIPGVGSSSNYYNLDKRAL